MNPFSWVDALKDGIPRREFADKVALTLKAGTHISLFGPRGTGKTTFLHELRPVLMVNHSDAPGWEMISVDLRRAISIPAFTGAISSALQRHPNRKIKRLARSAMIRMEANLGVNLGVVSGAFKASRQTEDDSAEILFGHLEAIADFGDNIVIAFDEFQRLASCPGEPLSIIRSALMGVERHKHVSLLLTGSLRERLEMMLHNSTEPIWDQTLDLQLPNLDYAVLTEYIEDKFQSTRRKIDERAVEDIVELMGGHPKRTQHLAWHIWDRATRDTKITREDVTTGLETLIQQGSPHTVDFERLLDTLLSGDESDINNARALFLLSGGGKTGSNLDAQTYGLSNAVNTSRALERLRQRGLVSNQTGHWRIADPLLNAWLVRQSTINLPL